MSQLTALQARMHSLRDIADILGAMKNLAQAEIVKLARFCTTQQDLFRTVEDAFLDFQQFYGEQAPVEAPDKSSLLVLMGSERGFCGGFNYLIHERLKQEAADKGVRLIVVGRRLAQRFADDQRVVSTIRGASNAEEVPQIISLLAEELARYPAPGWKIVHNSYGTGGLSPQVTAFSGAAAEDDAKSARRFEFPPLLNVPAEEARRQMAEQYLLALFYGVFYLSLMAENQERLRHMDGALNRLDDEQQQMRSRFNALRQESITEELEVIQLNANDAAVSGPVAQRRR